MPLQSTDNHCKWINRIPLVRQIAMTLLMALTLPWSLSCSKERREFQRQLKAARNGNAEAQNWIADRYSNGDNGIDKDKKLAFHWKMLAAENGNTRAQYGIAVMFENGSGVERNQEMACKWYQRCADNGFGTWQSEAQLVLGLAHFKGDRVERNLNNAYYYWAKAATAGQPAACAGLATWHLRKGHTSEDQHIAKALLEVAASAGYTEAQYALGAHLWDGTFIQHDLPLAEKWLKIAADKGHADAKAVLQALQAEQKQSSQKNP